MSDCRRTAVLTACLLISTQPCFSKSKENALRPTETRLVAIRDCLTSVPPLNGLQVDELGTGLLWGWKNWQDRWWRSGEYIPAGIYWPEVDWRSGEVHPPPQDSVRPNPPPQAYLDSLDRDLRACSFASGVKDKTVRDEILKSVSEDIDIKAKDCKDFGMGRAISVRVSTMRGDQQESGWEVFYKWVSVSEFPTTEQSIPHLSSPAVAELPPGQYVFRAQKKVSATHVESTDSRTITVGSQQVVECQLAIP
jgi:hypothetical protein